MPLSMIVDAQRLELAVKLVNELSGVGTLKERLEGLGETGDGSLQNGVSRLELAVLDQSGQVLDDLGVSVSVVHDNETLHLDSLGDNLENSVERLGLVEVVLGDASAHDESSKVVGSHEGHVEDLTSDVVVVDVDTTLGGLLEVLLEVSRLVVKGDIEAKVLGDEVALVLAAGNTNDLGTGNLGKLTSNRASGASGTGNENGLASLDTASDDVDTDPGSEAGHTKHTEVVLKRNAGDGRDLSVVALVANGVLGETGDAGDNVASLEVGVLGLDNLSETPGSHNGANLNGLDVRLLAGNLASQGRVQRHKLDLDQVLSVLEVILGGDGGGLVLEGLVVNEGLGVLS